MTPENPRVARQPRRPDIYLVEQQDLRDSVHPTEVEITSGMQRPDGDQTGTSQSYSGLRTAVIGALESGANNPYMQQDLAEDQQQATEVTAEKPEYRKFLLPVGKDPEEIFERCLATKEIRQLFARLKDLYQPPIGYDESDLMQVMLFGLFQAVRDYNSAEGNPFYPFARLCIEKRIFDLLKSANRKKQRPLNESKRIIMSEEGETLLDNGQLVDNLLDDSLPELPDMVSAKSRLEGLLRRFKWAGLSEFEMRCYRAYINGSTYEEMAAEFGVDIKSVDNALSRVWKKIGSLTID